MAPTPWVRTATARVVRLRFSPLWSFATPASALNLYSPTFSWHIPCGREVHIASSFPKREPFLPGSAHCIDSFAFLLPIPQPKAHPPHLKVCPSHPQCEGIAQSSSATRCTSLAASRAPPPRRASTATRCTSTLLSPTRGPPSTPQYGRRRGRTTAACHTPTAAKSCRATTTPSASRNHVSGCMGERPREASSVWRMYGSIPSRLRAGSPWPT